MGDTRQRTQNTPPTPGLVVNETLEEDIAVPSPLHSSEEDHVAPTESQQDVIAPTPPSDSKLDDSLFLEEVFSTKIHFYVRFLSVSYFLCVTLFYPFHSTDEDASFTMETPY